MLNYLSTRYHHRFDLTEASVFSLSPQSAAASSKDLEKDARDAGVRRRRRQPRAATTCSTSYRTRRRKVKYELVDPDRSRSSPRSTASRAYNTVRARSTARSRPPSPSRARRRSPTRSSRSPRTTSKTVCFIEGHGEPDIDDKQERARAARSQGGAHQRELRGARRSCWPAMARCRTTATSWSSPARSARSSSSEMQRARRPTCKRRRPRALHAAAARRRGVRRRCSREWGVKLGNDVVVDQVVRLFQGPALGLAPLVDTYGDARDHARHQGAHGLPDDALGQRRRRRASPACTATELVKTSASSWAETDLDGALPTQQARARGRATRKGPVPIAVAVDADLKQMGVGDGKDGAAGRSSAAPSSPTTSTSKARYYNRDLLPELGRLAGRARRICSRSARARVRASRVQFSAASRAR